MWNLDLKIKNDLSIKGGWGRELEEGRRVKRERG
jgi:hypothetical protein